MAIMTSQKTMITLRVQVTIPFKAKRPKRVSVVVKDRGALFFPYRRKLASIPLYKYKWTRQPGNLWQNEQAMAVPMNVPNLLKRKHLALQLYCLRYSSVQHKGIFNFSRVMQQQQQQNNELFIAVCYPKRVRKKMARQAQDVPTTSKVVNRSPAATHIVPEDSDLTTVPDTTCHNLGNTSCPTTDTFAKVPELCNSTSEPSLTMTPCSATSAHHQDIPPPRRVRFPDSGSVFVELLREYDLYAAEIKAKEEEEKPKEKTRWQPWRELMWMNVIGVHMLRPLLVRHGVLDLHRDSIPRLYGDASLPVQALLWAWTGVTLCVFYISCWVPAGSVRERDTANSSQYHCHQCRLDVPRLAHLCSVCEACVVDRHHHSFLTGNCVGRDNVRAYRLLCVLGAVGGMVCVTAMGAGALVFGKDVVPKDWMVGSMAVALMLVSCGTHACVSRRRRGRETSSRDACSSEGDLP